jgi:4-diphosphocytidyl-2-C-methyl-D-erythritol kinase
MPFTVVVVTPDVFVSSALAYTGIRPRPHRRGEDSLSEVVKSNDLDRWNRSLVNDFEPSVFDTFPQIRRIKNQLSDAGAGYASLSGSGSSVYGVFENSDEAEQARATIAQHAPEGYRTWVGKART